MTMTISSSLPILARRATLGVVSVVGLSACTLEATNPGPIQADALNAPSALNSIVAGAGRDLAEALNWTSYTGAAASREIFPGGSTGSFGISVLQQSGKLTDNDDNTHWNFGQRARWTAEDAVSRAKGVVATTATTATNTSLTQALIWAGYANRHMAENFCEGVINGGANGPSTVYLERAEANFSEAITVATAANLTALRDAATAGRASVRLLRNNSTGAASDAAAIANTFVYRMPYYQNDLDQYNRIFWASANQPYRAHTVWNTYIEAYRKANRTDSRVPFDSSLTVLVGDAAVGNLGRVRWYFQTKYPAIANDVPGALTSMNLRRTSLSLPQLAASNITDAWALLKRERGIELWLEGRRLGDLRRWSALSRPGALDPLEEIPGRDLCFATPLSEKQTNLNYKAP
jgi:hypothetical protein